MERVDESAGGEGQPNEEEGRRERERRGRERGGGRLVS